MHGTRIVNVTHRLKNTPFTLLVTKMSTQRIHHTPITSPLDMTRINGAMTANSGSPAFPR
jgi:hypothetical protein